MLRRCPILFPLLFLALTACAPRLDTRDPLPNIPDRRAGPDEIHYSATVGGVVGSREPGFTTPAIAEDEEIIEIEVGLSRGGNAAVVQCIRMRVGRGGRGRREILIGNERGARFERPFRPAGDAHLVGVSGRSGWYIDAIRFHFEDGNESPLYGGEGGDTSFDLRLSRNRRGRSRGYVTGLYGTAGEYVETLGLVFMPGE